MPEKTTKLGRRYTIDGRKFSWYPLNDDDQPSVEPITIPLRMKLSTVLDLNATQDMDVTVMRELIKRIIPGQDEAVVEMDLLDFQAMFTTWQAEYQLLSGVTLGESSSSSI